MKKVYIYAITGLAVICTGGYFLFFGSRPDDVTYRTEKVTRGDVVVQVRATGTINPVKTVQVGSQVSGIIEKIYVDFNSEVKRGQIIAQIDSTSLYASVKQAEANVERIQAQVNDAERNFRRTTELFRKNLVSQADLDAATTNYESSVAQLKQTQAALDQSRVNLRYAIIRAPIDGIVISRDVDVGQTVASSFQTPKLFAIANDLKMMQVEASVDEADIGQINVGQEVTFTVDAYPEEEFRGSVSQVRLSPIVVQNVVTYTVIIDVPNPELKLRPGMTATVSVLVNKRENVLRVPILAIRFQPPKEILEKINNEKSDSGEANAASERRAVKDRDLSGNMPVAGFPRTRTGAETAETAMQGRGRMGPAPGDVESSAGGSGVASRRSKLRVSGEKVWVFDDRKNLKPILVRIGLKDSRYVEIIRGDLKVGDEVIISSVNETASAGSRQSSPFGQQGPRMRF